MAELTRSTHLLAAREAGHQFSPRMAKSEIRSVPQYVYHPVLASGQEFRLLCLSPAPGKEDPISCSLTIHSLFRNPPEYEALSYTWGEFNGYEYQILVDDCSLLITSKLQNVLRHLREATQHRYLWIDAICININDVDEHGTQVHAMEHIFSTATRVVVWLDEPTDDFPVLEDMIERFRFQDGKDGFRLQDGLQTFNLLNAFCRNFSHPWFRRIWMLREYALAQSAVFVWGECSIDGRDLVDCVVGVWRALIRGDYMSILAQKDINEIRENLSGFLYFNWVKDKYADGRLDELEFMRILVVSQELHATDQRDKIFALLSSAPPALKKDLVPDYTISIQELYRSLGLALSLTTRIETVFKLIADMYLADEAASTPDWLPGWIDDLSLRLADLLGDQSAMTDKTQRAVIECLEILTSYERDTQRYLDLSPSAKTRFAMSLQNASEILTYFLRQPKSGRASALSFVDFDYNSASRSAENTILVANEIAAHLLVHGFFWRLLSAARNAEHRDDILECYLRPCIRHLGSELDSIASEFEEYLAARELKRHAHFIARAIISRMRQNDVEENQAVKGQRRSRIVRFLEEQGFKPLSRLRDSVDEFQPLHPEVADHTDVSESLVDDRDLPRTALAKVKDFMMTEAAFLPFLHMVSRIVYYSPIETIEAEIQACVQDKEDDGIILHVGFDVTWNIVALLEREDASQNADTCYSQFLSSLVISGTVGSCYATNCETYLKWRWPDTSEPLLQALRGCIEGVLSHNSTPATRVRPYETYFGQRDHVGLILAESTIPQLDGVTVSFSSSQVSGLNVYVDGTAQSIRDIGQQLAWLTAACRQSEARRPSLSEVILFRTDLGGNETRTFRIAGLPLKQLQQEKDACWLPLFPGTIIAHRWPIPERGSENGLELPFNLMISLSGPLYPMKFGRRFCFKAHSRILFPVSATGGIGEPLRVQWHYDSKRGTRVVPTWHGNQNDRVNEIETHDNKNLVEARTFLGYCRKAVVDLGTEKVVEEYRAILYSGLEDENHVPGTGLPTAITLGTGGLLPISLTANVPIIQQKAQLLAASLERDYMDVVYEAEDRPVILYDTNGSARGWMVPLSCVLLHMVHTWSAKNGTITDDYPRTSLACQSGAAAREVLLNKWDFVVRKTISKDLHKDKLVRDLVMQFWKDICQKQFQDLLAMTQADYSFEFQTEKIYGWEYMDVVDRKYSRRKQLTFKTNWGLFREQCIILFAKNLGHVIQPAPDVHVCDRWDPDRTKRMYLTATIECLTTLAYQNGGERESLTTFRLTNKGYWHYQPKELFVDCEGCGERKCVKRPQYLRSTPPQNTHSLVPPSGGAVIFGRKLLEKPQLPAQDEAAARSSSERHSRFNFLGKAKLLARNHLERMVSRNKIITSSHGTSNTPLSSDESGYDE